MLQKQLGIFVADIFSGLPVGAALCAAVVLLALTFVPLSDPSSGDKTDRFDPGRSECQRYNWHKVSGVQQPVRLCYEWIDLSDPSGNTHAFQPGTEIVLGADVKLHYDRGERVDGRLFILLAFIGTVLALGMALSRFLIARYRMRLETMGKTEPS